ncbi:ATP-binding cassette domain-containing protein [uncultured Tateyamaria sp.]|uniref:energy-coupling factor ABC transporter ATP-binding protein n=1 Tax=uncultured Tateyamaria sp. TaxID=455651 RepID=UPI00262A81DB|nr:ATP-binding cassette domain-containing protein [uncultured Tateyamaria sp.]
MSVELEQAIITRRGTQLLGPIDLSLSGTGFTIVLGPNGAGKTSLLKVLHGVTRLSSGRVRWSVPDKEAREAQAYVFQKPIMLRRSVRQNLAFPLQLLNFPKAEIAERVTHWSGRIGLEDALNRPATRLSGGEQQKLALARALIREPQVLFLDEPCANLDGRSTLEIEKLLLAASTAGTRIIMTTHDLGQARRLASDVVFLLNGKVREQATAQDFFSAQQTEEAQAFLNGDIIE